MRIFSYRNKRRAKKALLILAVILAAALLFCLIRFVYLQRFLVYTPTGVQLDYTQDLQSIPVDQDDMNLEAFPVEIHTATEGVAVSAAGEEPLAQLSGFFVTTAMFQNVEAVRTALAQQESCEALMLDMKSIYGNFYYASSVPGAIQASVEIASIDALVKELAAQDGLYLIARIPSFSDSNFALANQRCGLPLSSGALWMDDNGCYWLDPLDSEVQSYLVSIAEELSSMGFDEVVFGGFRIPDSANIVYDAGELTREEAAAEAAQDLRDALSACPIRVSFGSDNAQIAQVSDRIYFEDAEGAAVAGLVEPFQEGMENPAAQIVFLTASRDTRFDGYSILRPLIEEPAAD